MSKPKILALSFLFPNRTMPDHGIFVQNRLVALQRYADIKVINPIAWSPLHARLKRFKHYADIPTIDTIGGIEVHHPRFFSIPGHLKSMEALSYRLAVSPVVERIRESFKFELVDLHWTYPDLPTGIWLANQYDKKLLLTIRGLAAFYRSGDLVRAEMVRRGIVKSDRIICLSGEIREITDRITGQPEKSYVVRNGVDVDQFQFMPQSVARTELGIPMHEKLVVSVGSLIYEKGFDLIIMAFSELVKKGGKSDLRLYIIGSEGPAGNYRAELLQLVEKHDLSEHVIFLGQVPNSELKSWYNAADIFCLASRTEGSPNVLTEALACGCPSIATNVGSVQEIMESEKDLGICIPGSEIDSLVTHIPRMLRSQIDRKQNAARFQKYSWDWCAANVSKHYQAMLGN